MSDSWCIQLKTASIQPKLPPRFTLRGRKLIPISRIFKFVFVKNFHFHGVMKLLLCHSEVRLMFSGTFVMANNVCGFLIRRECESWKKVNLAELFHNVRLWKTIRRQNYRKLTSNNVDSRFSVPTEDMQYREATPKCQSTTLLATGFSATWTSRQRMLRPIDSWAIFTSTSTNPNKPSPPISDLTTWIPNSTIWLSTVSIFR